LGAEMSACARVISSASRALRSAIDIPFNALARTRAGPKG
jgi:hypothetical protein